MADKATLLKALRNAHNAGDTDGAARIAGMIKAQDSAQQAASPEVAAPWYTPITSIPKNGAEVAGGLYDAIRHPLDTASGLGKLFDGAVANIPGVSTINDWAVAHGLAPAYDKTNESNDQQIASNVGHQIHENFNTPTRAWNTVATHPVDALMTLAPGIGQVGKVADAVGFAKTGSALAKTAEWTNPITLAGKAGPVAGKFVGRMASYPLAGMTGTSPEAVNLAASTGMDGGSTAEAFRANMRGAAPQEQVVRDARGALGKIAANRSNAYETGMRATGNSNAVVDTQPIRQALDDARQSLYVKSPAASGGNTPGITPLEKGSATDFKTLDTIEGYLKDWEAHPDGRTPIGMDALKQKLDELQPAYGNPALDNQRRLVTVMQNAIKAQINSAEPSYAKAMSDYSTSKAAQSEIQKSLSLGRKASVDTSLNKLKSSIGGEQVNRSAHVTALEANGAPNLRASLAGQIFSPKTPKGDLARKIAAVIAGSGWWNPAHLAALPLTSPRVVGELAHVTGRVSRRTGTLLGKFNLNDPRVLQALVAARLSQGLQQ